MKILLCLMTCVINPSLLAENVNQFEKATGLKGSYNEALQATKR